MGIRMKCRIAFCNETESRIALLNRCGVRQADLLSPQTTFDGTEKFMKTLTFSPGRSFSSANYGCDLVVWKEFAKAGLPTQ